MTLLSYKKIQCPHCFSSISLFNEGNLKTKNISSIQCPLCHEAVALGSFVNRSKARYPMKNFAACRALSKNVEFNCQILDFSGTGLRFECNQSLSVGDVIKVESEAFSAEIETVWMKLLKNSDQNKSVLVYQYGATVRSIVMHQSNLLISKHV